MWPSWRCNSSIVAPYSLKMEISDCIIRPLCSAKDVNKKLPPGPCVLPTNVKAGAWIEATKLSLRAATKLSLLCPTSHFLTCPRSSAGVLLGASHSQSLSTTQSGPRKPCFLSPCPPGTIPARDSSVVVNPVTQRLPETDTQASLNLGFRLQMISEGSLCLVIDFGDTSEIQIRIRNMSEEITVTAYHQYMKEGIYMLKAVIYPEFYGTKVEVGPYFVEIVHEVVSVFMNSSSVHEDEVLIFVDSHTKQKSTVIMHHFPPISSYNVSFTSQNQVGDSQPWPCVTVWYKMQPVSVYTNGTVFATDVDITFVAVTKEMSPLEFEWHFGEDLPVRTTSRSIKKKFHIPQRYCVMVKASNGITSVVSEPHPISVQKKIVANRLSSTSSALVNASVTFECRINFGTDVAYLWNFGDGTVSLGNSINTHIYSREGEFTVAVLAFNDISSTLLKKQIFIVHTPCQPPPVKNMGPGKVQVWRSQPVRLGVTFEAAILCDISQGLSYTWSIMKSDGSHVSLPPSVDNHRQTISLPSYFLEYGNYTAVAKVQVEGSVVYSTYSVGVDVRMRAPVSVVSEGTHLFVPKTPTSTISLSGSQSYDPDNPGIPLRYHWRCAPTGAPGHPCFDVPAPTGLNSKAQIISFAATDLSDGYDQFVVTLTVSSGSRTSTEAQVFLSLRSKLTIRFIHISRINFKNSFVNWNEELSLQAMCEDCGDMHNLSYSWDLFLVNATEQNSIEAVELLDSSRFGAILKLSESNPLLVEPNTADSCLATTALSLDPLQNATGKYAPSTMGRHSQVSAMGVHQVFDAIADASAQQDAYFEAYYDDIQEAIPSEGRQPGNSINFPESESSRSDDKSPSDGDNLVSPFHSTDNAVPSLMIDWPKSLISPAIFQGYTSTGIMEQTVTLKPFSLRRGETYVIQASLASKHILLGKAQLYLTVNRGPQDVACQVQPHHGHEAHTIFSIFCMSGKLDFHYEFSYRIGNSSKRTLYHGRDAQYYFALPAGEPLDSYRVMVFTEITDGEGSKLQPCAVAVTVLPRYHRNVASVNYCIGEDLYNSSLKNLSILLLMGSYLEIRNYITMITRILSCLAKENRGPLCGQWSRIQDAFISSVCKLDFADQEEIINSIIMLRDLINFPNKLSFMSAVLILKYTRILLSQNQLSGRFVTDRKLMLELIFLVSGVLEVSDHEKLRNVDYLREEGIKIISDFLLSSLSVSSELQVHTGTGEMEFQACLHYSIQNTIQSVGSVQVHLPSDLAVQSPAKTDIQKPCYISLLILFKKSLYPGGPAPGQVGGVVSLRLYNCSSRQPFSRRWLQTPVTVEFGEEDDLDNRRNKTTYVLSRDKINFHQFIGLSENSQEYLQIRIKFSKTITRAFPIMLLVRFSKKPTPSDFLVKHIYLWDEQIAQIYVPAASLKDVSLGYLTLLDADYDRTPPNKYLVKEVNYTVDFQWIQCLFWDKNKWKSNTFPPQPGTFPEKINCSYNHLTTFTLVRRKLNASFERSDISKLQSCPENKIPIIFIVLFMILYAFLVTKSKQVDHHEKNKSGYIFLQESTSPDQQLYAIVIDTGFRAPAQLTAKVYIVLYGKNGLSETKELYCPEKPLFERNSRHTFILSVPGHLGPLWKIRLWHNNCGPSPGWYISHLLVKELHTGQSWCFPAECWLAAGQGDGRVERELIPLHQGLGFWKLLYTKFTEYLEDVHIWISVYSRPSYSCYLHTQRLTVSFSLLCMYSCLTAALTATQQEKLSLDIGITYITHDSFRTGLLCTLVASPGALLLSLLFRFSQCNTSDFFTGNDSDQKADPAPSKGLADLISQRQRVLPSWVGSAAWAVCAMVSIACGLGTGVLGYRFDSTQCVRWLHLLFLSVVSCAFVTQPLMICMMALGFAWKRKDDKAFYAESLYDATKDLESELEQLSQTRVPFFSRCDIPDSASEFEKILAIRQRARLLRWAHPPSMAQLRATKERMRKENHARSALRDFFMYTLMLVLLMFITYGKFSWEEYALNQAIRNEFTRNPTNSFSGLRSTDDWWEWSLTRFLDGLYGTDVQEAQSRALGGKCYLIGTSVIKQLNVSPNSLCKLPSPFSALIKDFPSACSPKFREPVNHYMTEPANQKVTPSHPKGCMVKEYCTLHLGRTRPEAHTALTNLRANQWIGRGTKAVSLHFTLYNAPTQLLTSVSLRADMTPTGHLLPSSWVESVSVFLSDSALRYLLMVPELVFLVLNLVHLCFQLYSMIEKGILNYWRKPSNWLELSVVGLGLAYYAVSSHLVILAENVIDQFHKGFFQEFVDLSLIASWNQRMRWLQGILLFLLTLKSISLLGTSRTMAFCSSVLHHSLSSIIMPGLTGVLMVAVHSHLCRFLFYSLAPRSTFGDSSHVLPFRFLGRNRREAFSGLSKSNQWVTACYYGPIFTVMTTLWLTMLRGSFMIFTRKRKSFQSKCPVRLKDAISHTWGKALIFLGLERPRLEETQLVENHNYYLDEISDLLNELLLKINGLSESLHLSVLDKQSKGKVEAKAEDNPLVGVSAYQATRGLAYVSYDKAETASDLL
ncbi:polycystic kidney disease protein 1-like 1 [Orycteropus afer afer]|uniref:Polycystin-1-like protein 1 n=1 Tax=Orycteropus afer afer TaxID=1230840 RepID=A0A8B7A2Z7_ORYAF|nr:polycystic kidney disease protein 1-like 1 [Orycteropus afer afer]